MNKELNERIPVLVKYVRQTIAAVAQASIECRPIDDGRKGREWYKPFEEITDELKRVEYMIVKKLREHE